MSSLNGKYTAFEANGKLYKFTRIPFGEKNGVAEFQRLMREFIEENLNGTFSYVDNIAIVGHNQADHNQNVAQVDHDRNVAQADHDRNVASFIDVLNESKTIVLSNLLIFWVILLVI